MLLHLRSEPVRDHRAGSRIASRSSATTRSGPIEDMIRRNERLACIGLLAAGIAHEINNPTRLGPAGGRDRLGHQGLARRRRSVTACLQNIVTSMDRCGRIVRTLLRYSRQEPAEKQACSINDVVEQAMDLARPYGSSHGAELRLELDPGASAGSHESAGNRIGVGQPDPQRHRGGSGREVSVATCN